MDKNKAIKEIKIFMKDNGLLYHEVMGIAVINIELLNGDLYEILDKFK